MRLYDLQGQRKYLTPVERTEFLQAAKGAPEEVRAFCWTLAYTGCRISEALALTAARVDLGDGVLVIEGLKKRRKGVYRAVPVPPPFLDALDLAHDLTAARRQPDGGAGIRLWQWSRATAWRRVCDVMEAAGIAGLHATPKGLRRRADWYRLAAARFVSGANHLALLELVALENGADDLARSTDLAGVARGLWKARWTQCEAVTSHLVLYGHMGVVLSVAIHENVVASGSLDGTVRLWDRKTGEQIAMPFCGEPWGVTDVAIDGNLVVFGSCDGTLRFWHRETEQMIQN